MKLSQIHENMFRAVESSTMFGNKRNLPVNVQADDGSKPLIVMERWTIMNDELCKTFRFLNIDRRNRFMEFIFDYEREVGHHGKIEIDHMSVKFSLTTKNVGKPTELDKEYARFVDTTFKDVSYSRQ